MRAIVCHALEGIDGLKLEENWPEPQPGPGDVLVQVKAAALNFPDVLMLRGLYQEKPPLPFIPGIEMAGTVLAVGDKVTRYRAGDNVVSIAGRTLAERGIFKQELVIPMPASLDFETASGICLTYFTSYHALKQRAAIQPGETLLVLGAAGGVGATAVELGKVMGATVIAAASSTAKLEFARKLGADHTINYSTEDLRDRIKQITGGKGIDVVYDPVGGPYTEPALRSLAWKGRYLVIGFAAGDIPRIPINLTLLKGASIVGVFFGAFSQREPAEHRQNVKELWALIETGRIRPAAGEVHEFADYARAFAALEQRRALGKVVIRI
jgi:NADPH2:quinone reductase